MSTSATEDRTTRARTLGLPTNVEEATQHSGNEDNPSLPTGLDSQRQEVESQVRFICDTCGAEGQSWQVRGPCWFYIKRRMCDGIIRQVPRDLAAEKLAINAARKLRIDEIDHLQKEVNALDERYDAIEDEEIALALEKRRINDPD